MPPQYRLPALQLHGIKFLGAHGQESLRDLVAVALRDEVAGPAGDHDLGSAPLASGEHRRPAGHRFDWNKRKRLIPPRRQDREVRLGVP